MEIIFSTSHGEYKIEKWFFNQTLNDLCTQNKIPHQSVTFYGEKDNSSFLIIGLHKTLSEFSASFNKILIKPDRNIDYNSVILKPINIKTSSNPSSEYTFPNIKSSALNHFELSEEECKKFVTRKVSAFFNEDVVIDPKKKIVLGISGGGDSNTLIMSFLESGLVEKDQLIAVMMLGIPDWDKGQSRAQAICVEYGVELKFISADQVNQLLGRKQKGGWVEDFETVFPDADLEVLGTLCIRLSLLHVAKENNAQAIVTGLNLEDILAECLFSTIKGSIPPPFPVRPIDGIPFWHPLYQIPKKIIDGCYPKYSLQNYNDRYPSKMLGRAIPYYLAQSMHGLIPGVEFDLLEGFKEISKQNKSYGVFDSQIGFTILDGLTDDVRDKWRQFIEGNASQRI